MDQKRLIIAIAVSIAILMGFQLFMPHPAPLPEKSAATTEDSTGAAPSAPTPVAAAPAAVASAAIPPAQVPRVKISAPQLRGSISLLGARIDDIVLRSYRDTPNPSSPQVQLLDPASTATPYYVQFGWSAAAGSMMKLPDANTVWTASAAELTATTPVTLSWNNGAGLLFGITLSIDDNYMFTARQSVRNTGATPVQLFPWQHIVRGYTPPVLGTYLVHEGLIGVFNGGLYDSNTLGVGNGDFTYSGVKSAGKKNNGVALDKTSTTGWAGITDKYWLTALIPNQSTPVTGTFSYTDPGHDSYQVEYQTAHPEAIAPGAQAQLDSHVFIGAKVVSLLETYEHALNVPKLSYAVDWGLFFFITKPFYYAIDFLNKLLGNFGLAIMVFTVCVKALFFPLANYSYRSMSKMKLLGPKIQAMREQYKGEPTKLQQATMQLYKAEKVNPVSGCLPMVVQVPVFFSLYKVIYITIEMRQAPFFGWIRDLSVPDPTNVFNLFGLLHFDPTTIAPFLHLGVWPLIMGFTMFMQQKLNPPPPDPVQARIFQFMPLLFMFMLARFPAGLVIYWSWNNTLTIAQQWLIMRKTRLARPSLART
jgi:YidC/Oxa1 family membrane protein insertase